MIVFLEGILDDKQPTRIVMNVSGVGYEVLIPLSSFDHLPAEGETCRIHTFDYVREDQHTLFGFVSNDEKEMFQLLLGISGVGPKLALGALSGMNVRELRVCVVEGDAARLSGIKGIGKKTAERMIVELRDRIGKADALDAIGNPADGGDSRLHDVSLALISLGYKPAEAQRMVETVAKSASPDSSVEDMIRLALSR